MRTLKTNAIILKRINFKEADRILTVLTPDYGKILVRAPGVRKLVSRRSSHIELLNLSLLTLYRNPHTNRSIVIEAQALEEFSSIKNTLGKIGFAYYVCELTDALCAQNEENSKVFYIVRNTLNRLSHSLNNEGIIENFEDELLVSMGFLPQDHRIRDKRNFIENILEKKLKTRRLLPLFLSSRES